jgi:tRNA(fMet)-specific endonuclease VapC
MVTHLLDTSVYSQPLKPRPSSSVMSRWNAIGNESLSVSVICEAEVLFGLEAKGSAQLDAAYTNLLEGRLTVIPVERDVGKEFAKLKAAAKKKGRLIPDFDLMIAATAKVHGLILATLNYRHFCEIDGVAVEDWST